MKNSIIIVAILFTCSIATNGQMPYQAEGIILMLKNGQAEPSSSLGEQKLTVSKKIDSLNQIFHSLTVEKQLLGKKINKYIYIIQFPEGTNLEQIIEKYYNTGEIEYAEPDYQGTLGGVRGVIPDDQYYFLQWGLNNDGTFPILPAKPGADIEMENAWGVEQGDSNIIVAFIDTGVKFDHPELGGRIWQNYDEMPGNGIDDDTNGYVDDVRGWDFANSDNDPTDGHGHGTNVTGIVGANGNNTIGVAGVDWNCKLMILKGFKDNGSGSQSYWAGAVYYAVDNGARVISMSFGTTNPTVTFQNAITYARNNNVVLVACMMNTNSNTVFYPAGFLGVIAVGSTDPDDTRSVPFPWDSLSGSNYGSHISVVAPGNWILGLDYLDNNNYAYWAGTSQAAPHVAGLASLLLAQDPDRTPVEVKLIIEETAEDTIGDPAEDTPGWDQYYGYGRINAYNALYLLISDIKPMSNQHQTSYIFPNPSNGSFTISFPARVRDIQIYNSVGKLMLREKVEGQTTKNYRLNEYGVYMVQINMDKQMITQKLIISK